MTSTKQIMQHFATGTAQETWDNQRIKLRDGGTATQGDVDHITDWKEKHPHLFKERAKFYNDNPQIKGIGSIFRSMCDKNGNTTTPMVGFDDDEPAPRSRL